MLCVLVQSIVKKYSSEAAQGLLVVLFYFFGALIFLWTLSRYGDLKVCSLPDLHKGLMCKKMSNIFS